MSPAPRLVREAARTLDRRPRYNYTWSKPDRLVYVRVAKVATRSMTFWLRNELELEPRYLTGRPLPTDPLHRNLVVAFVRNPWDRLVSCWYDKVASDKPYWKGTELEGLDFPDFVEAISRWDLDTCDRHVRRQTALVPVGRVDLLGRFEKLEEGLTELARRLGIDASTFPSRNTSKGRDPYEQYYDAALADRVGELYAGDAAVFGYRFGR